MNSLLLLLATFVLQSASQQCKPGAHSVRGHYLKGHVISSGNAANIGECLVKCANEPRCKSINFRFAGSFCELNNADRSTHPSDYGPASEWQAYSDYPDQTPDPTRQVRLAVNRQKFILTEVQIYGIGAANMSFAMKLLLDNFFRSRCDDFNYPTKRARKKKCDQIQFMKMFLTRDTGEAMHQ